MMRKTLISAIGVGGLALATLVTQPFAPHAVTAQTTAATPAAGAALPSQSATTTTAAQTSQINARYQDFVKRLAANLGESDTTKVDQAIRTTLKQEVDAKVTSGDIAGKVADAIKAKIDSPDFPADMIGMMAMLHPGMMHPGMMHPGMMYPGMSGHGPGGWWQHKPGERGQNGGPKVIVRGGSDHGSGGWEQGRGGMQNKPGMGNGGYQKSNSNETVPATPTA